VNRARAVSPPYSGSTSSDGGDVAVVKIFERIDRRRIDPAGAGRRDENEDGAVEGVDALQFLQRQPGAFLRRFG
jgi:hypothetical protein